MNTPSANGPMRRRSVRVLTTIPLLISGRKSDGTRFEGTAETVIVNKHGAKIRTQEKLSCGIQIRIAIVSPYRFQMARVVSEESQDEFGIELAEAQNFWGVYFPPEDWSDEQDETSELSSETRSPPSSSTPQQNAEAGSRAGAVMVETPTQPSESRRVDATPDIPQSGSPAVIRGIAATRTPFQEKGHLIPVGTDRANFSVRPLVEPGTKVKVILLPGEHVLNAKVAKLSRTRVHGKWQIVLKFDLPIFESNQK
jgi:hypothetical protein